MSDISLAVGDGTRRMTYAELAAVRGISETLVRRRKWLKQIGNDGVVRVLVPSDEAPAPPSSPPAKGGGAQNTLTVIHLCQPPSSGRSWGRLWGPT